MPDLQTEASTRQVEPERRGNGRFPIVREVQYRTLSSRAALESGSGTTVNISSAGVLFISEAPLTPGKRLEVAISWPAQLDGKCSLKLVAKGKVVRCDGRHVAVQIEKYEFRTVGSKDLSPAEF